MADLVLQKSRVSSSLKVERRRLSSASSQDDGLFYTNQSLHIEGFKVHLCSDILHPKRSQIRAQLQIAPLPRAKNSNHLTMFIMILFSITLFCQILALYYYYLVVVVVVVVVIVVVIALFIYFTSQLRPLLPFLLSVLSFHPLHCPLHFPFSSVNGRPLIDINPPWHIKLQ